MSLPLVTIGLTTFNAADTVERAVASAIAQTWSPIEIIVVDDCSTDETCEILYQLAVSYPILRIFRNLINSGVAVSRNRLIEEAKGEFIAFFDDDDESAPERIEMQVKRVTEYERDFAEKNSLVVCHTARRRIYSLEYERIEVCIGQTEGQVAPKGPAVAKRILMGMPLKDSYGACPTCCQLARLKTYLDVGGFDPSMRRSEDTDFAIRLAVLGGHFVGIEKPLVVQWMTRSVEKSHEEEYRNQLLLFEKHRLIMESVGQYNFCKKWLYAKHAWLKGDYFEFITTFLFLFSRFPFLTVSRLIMSFPNLRLNLAYGRFYR